MSPTPLRILGIDPGSRITGYGVIEVQGAHSRCVAEGVIRLSGDPLEQRLLQLLTGLRALIAEHRPVEVAMEQVWRTAIRAAGGATRRTQRCPALRERSGPAGVPQSVPRAGPLRSRLPVRRTGRPRAAGVPG
jgi:hypothetical protein